MTKRNLTSAFTSALLSAVATAGAISGLILILFDADVGRILADTAVPPPSERREWVSDPGHHPDDPMITANTLASWREVPAVAGTARAMLAARPDLSPPRRLLDIAALLAVRPTDGDNWLAFADATLRLGYGRTSAVQALDMSAITARREAATMLARALFVLGAWEEMPPDRRSAALSGLADLRWRLGKPELESIAALVSAKTPEVRAEIKAALPARLTADRKFQKAVGL